MLIGKQRLHGVHGTAGGRRHGVPLRQELHPQGPLRKELSGR